MDGSSPRSSAGVADSLEGSSSPGLTWTKHFEAQKLGNTSSYQLLPVNRIQGGRAGLWYGVPSIQQGPGHRPVLAPWALLPLPNSDSC